MGGGGSSLKEIPQNYTPIQIAKQNDMNLINRENFINNNKYHYYFFIKYLLLISILFFLIYCFIKFKI